MNSKKQRAGKFTDKANERAARGIGRRRLLTYLGVGGLAINSLPAEWGSPVVSSVMLPAHAATTAAPEPEACVVDTQAGGPLVGNAFGAESCQEGCEAAAADKGVELCDVTESLDAAGAVQCTCFVDLP